MQQHHGPVFGGAWLKWQQGWTPAFCTEHKAHNYVSWKDKMKDLSMAVCHSHCVLVCGPEKHQLIPSNKRALHSRPLPVCASVTRTAQDPNNETICTGAVAVFANGDEGACKREAGGLAWTLSAGCDRKLDAVLFAKGRWRRLTTLSQQNTA